MEKSDKKSVKTNLPESHWWGQRATTRGPGALVGPLLVIPEASDARIFYTIFSESIGHFKYWENLKYKNYRK